MDLHFADQAEPPPRLVPRPLRPRKRFVQHKLLRGELRTQIDCAPFHSFLQRRQRSSPAASFCPSHSRQGDVRVVTPRLRHKPASSGRRYHGLLQRQQLRSQTHARPKNARLLEKTQPSYPHRNPRRPHPSQFLHNTRRLFLTCRAQELQRHVPAFRRGPSQTIFLGRKLLPYSAKRTLRLGRQRNTNEKPHA